jgi:hypothetical protein
MAYNNLAELFKATADAIRSKTGSTNPIVATDFPAAIRGISGGGGGSTTSLFVNYDPDKEYEESSLQFLGRACKLTDDAWGGGDCPSAFLMFYSPEAIGEMGLPEFYQYIGGNMIAIWDDGYGVLMAGMGTEDELDLPLILSVPSLTEYTESIGIPSAGTWLLLSATGAESFAKSSFLFGK